MNLELSANKWFSRNGIYVRGYCYAGGCMLENESLAEFFSVRTEEELEARLRITNGIFDVIIDTAFMHAAAIDGTRLYPIFFSALNGSITIADQPDKLYRQGFSFDTDSASVHKVAGFTPAGTTLIKEIRQVKPFHYVVFSEGGYIQKAYRSYLIKQNEERHISKQELATAIEEAFTRTLGTINGKRIVVPLSGGYDSRLVAVMLKESGCGNVVCYTIGAPQSDECVTACKVADTLGFPIYQIDNLNSEFSNFTDSEYFKSYCHFIGAYSNFTWLFEVPAILTLRDNGVITEGGAVFMPGHTGDFLAGNNLYKSMLTQHSGIGEFARAIMFDKFIYGYNADVYLNLVNYFRKSFDNGYTCTSAFHWFIMQHHLAGNINNAARVYEYFGYETRLPYWDKELTDMMLHLPYTDFKDCSLYRETLEECFFTPFNVNFKGSMSSVPARALQSVKSRVRRFMPHWLHGFTPDIEGEWFVASRLMQESPHIKAHTTNEFLQKWYLDKVQKL